MNFTLRKAKLEDRAEIEKIVVQSVRGLANKYYSQKQIELSITSVFGVDTELIDDGNYFVAESHDKKIVGCGGWSKRKTLYGASRYSESRDSANLDPKTDSAKIRAFFIHPDWARKGIGKAIIEKCELEAKSLGFNSAEMMATLPGIEFYKHCGYQGSEKTSVPVGEEIDIECITMKKMLG